MRNRKATTASSPVRSTACREIGCEGGGAAFFQAVEKMGLEGRVSKRRESPYRSGKLDSWVKTKCWELGDFDLLGMRREPGKPVAALMARNGRYAGTAAVTLPSSLRERLRQRVQASRAAKPTQRVPRDFADDVEWVKPGITGRVKFLRGEHILRHASGRDGLAQQHHLDGRNLCDH